MLTEVGSSLSGTMKRGRSEDSAQRCRGTEGFIRQKRNSSSGESNPQMEFSTVDRILCSLIVANVNRG